MKTPTRTSLISQFPADFVWGVATSAFQIEGAFAADGKGASIWDTFCRQNGVIADGSNGDVACDHYRLWQGDLDLIKRLGMDAYRFSISWPRVRPTGAGAWNEAGMDFYERLVDGMLERGIKPYLTLNHWDLPQALQDKGGWADRDTVHRFVEYAVGVTDRLGGRVASITTHNEPWVMATLGHDSGIFAPGVKDVATAAQVSHHLLLSHGLALRAMRAQGCRTPMGIVLNHSPIHAASDSAADRAKARLEDGKGTRWYMDPLFKGYYPDDVLAELGERAPRVQEGDMVVIGTPMDFLGVNYYTRTVVSADAVRAVPKDERMRTDMDWEVYPEGMTELLLRLHDDYCVPPMIITENGAAYDDPLDNGAVHDARRTAYLSSHIAAVAEAIARGVRIDGYMVWSLFDNFEWASGYEKRFGIVHVDYQTQVRTPKDSALWYRDLLQARTRAPARRDAIVAGG